MGITLVHRSVCCSLLAACVLAGCGGKRSETPATQIAAKVNREEISIHQVNYFLQRQGEIAPDEVDAASRRTLEALVDQEVAVQAALDQHLDQDPQIVQALEAARRDVLARAYADRLTQSAQPPTATEVKQYYDSQPALFSRRRLYTLVDTAVDASPAEQKAITAQLPTTRGAADVAAVLRQAGLRFGSRRSTVGPESLPLTAVGAMAGLGEGQSLLVSGPHDAHIYTVLDARAAPLGLDEARPHIERFLAAERRHTLLQQQIAALRRAATIEYRGRFAQAAQAAEQQPPAATSVAQTGHLADTARAVPALNAVALTERAASSPDSKTHNPR
ncbi:MAG: EpsD family peptidyl-prolyl cis-trans isomerase [Rhizobacter sp.]|nr:EpsD family peptidyl-prolyl cis-trans isomerase [Rhizobacter sp.]